jgi:hypothetical protein
MLLIREKFNTNIFETTNAHFGVFFAQNVFSVGRGLHQHELGFVSVYRPNAFIDDIFASMDSVLIAAINEFPRRVFSGIWIDMSGIVLIFHCFRSFCSFLCQAIIPLKLFGFSSFIREAKKLLRINGKIGTGLAIIRNKNRPSNKNRQENKESYEYFRSSFHREMITQQSTKK